MKYSLVVEDCSLVLTVEVSCNYIAQGLLFVTVDPH